MHLPSRTWVLLVLAFFSGCSAVDFKQYQTCENCIDAGFGWCPIRRICGGFANTQCGEGAKYVTEEYEKEVLGGKTKKKKKKKKAKTAETDLPDVVSLTRDTFVSSVAKGDSLWMVQFCTPWSDSCTALTSEWALAAKALRGVVRFGVVNADDEVDLAAEYDVLSYPTIFSFISNRDATTKVKPHSTYEGQKTGSAILSYAKAEVKSLFLSRASDAGIGALTLEDPVEKVEEKVEEKKVEEKVEEKKEEKEETKKEKKVEKKAEKKKVKKVEKDANTEEGGDPWDKKEKKKKKKKKGKGKKKAFRPGSGDHVGHMTKSELETLFAQKYVTVVHAFDPESAGDSEIAKKFDGAATSLRGVAVLSAINAVVSTDLPYGMTAGHVYLFKPGASAPASVADADAATLTAAVMEASPGNVVAKQLTEQSHFDACLNRATCVVAFLPHLTDGLEKREAYIRDVTEAAGLARTVSDVLWAEAGGQPALEGKFDVLTYPTLVVLDTEEKKGGVVLFAQDGADGSFGTATLLDAIFSEETKTTPYKNTVITTTAQWDGKPFTYPQ